MDKLFYLCGGISNVPVQEAATWRMMIEQLVKEESFGEIRVFNPLKIELVDDEDRRDAVAMKYELDMLRKSDLVIVYFNDPASLGSMAEMAIAYEHRIPIIGINSRDKKLHPWQEEMCDYIFEDLMDFWEYIKINYLGEI